MINEVNHYLTYPFTIVTYLIQYYLEKLNVLIPSSIYTLPEISDYPLS